MPRGWGKIFSSLEEVKLAYDARRDRPPGARSSSAPTATGGEAKLIETTVGRVIFNLALPAELGKFYNETMGRKQLRGVVADCYRLFKDPDETARGRQRDQEGRLRVLDARRHDDRRRRRRDVGDEGRASLADAEEEAEKVERQYRRGLVTEDERLRELEVIWNERPRPARRATSRSASAARTRVYMMADSGAKGNMNQISQMAGMRGLVLDPKGRIIDIPIKSNFREGLTVLEYFLSTHGARKGLADTALRTADSGYLTRRLVDVAQDVIITMTTAAPSTGCGSSGPTARASRLATRTSGPGSSAASLASPIVHPETGEIIVDAGEESTDRASSRGRRIRDIVGEVIAAGVEKIHLRTVMACEATHGVCADVLRAQPGQRRAGRAWARRSASSPPSRSASRAPS